VAQESSVAPAAPSPVATRAIAWAILRIVSTGVGMLAFYFLLPFAQVTPLEAFTRLLGGVALLIAGVGFLVRSIVKARHPRLRAIEAVGLSFWLMVVVFAIIYMSLSTALPASFSEPLTEVGALYFTVAVLSTVGFGDIAALTDAARLIVTTQILLGLVLLGAVVRLFLRAGDKAAVTRNL